MTTCLICDYLGTPDLIRLEEEEENPLADKISVPVKGNYVLWYWVNCESHIKSEEDHLSQMYPSQSKQQSNVPFLNKVLSRHGVQE